MKNIKTVLPVLLAVVAMSADAYELATHAAITFNAYQKSNLAQNSALVQDLGIDGILINQATKGKPFGETYFDVRGEEVRVRETTTVETVGYENNVIKKLKDIDKSPLALSGWLMRGAIREDDLGEVFGVKNGDDPHDDPYGNIFRVFNHFFDPINNRPLTLLDLKKLGDTNPNWAIGTDNAFPAFPATVVEKTDRRNHFTVYDAREMMYRALTGMRKDGTVLNPAGDVNAKSRESMRKTYWATLFRSLGDILHLNQDMAQPQHTRNEAHTGLGGAYSNGVTGHSSFYEQYIDARASNEPEFYMKDEGFNTIKLAPLVYDGVAVPSFSKYSDFWSTGIGSASLTGSGLADYSNHNFFTNANNFGSTLFDNPSSDVDKYTPTVSPFLLPDGSQIIKKYLSGKDGLPPIRLTQQGILDTLGAELGTKTWYAYTLDRNVYDDMASLLVPRAVAYSAGLINYFFRGKMEISLPNEGIYGIIDHNDPASNQKDTGGFKKIKLKLKNVTPGGTGIEPMGPAGKLVAVAKFHRNVCYTPTLSGEYGSPGIDWKTCRDASEEIVVSDAVAVPDGINGDAQQLTFNFQTPVPINATDLFLQVVYRGPLGEEGDAVVVATKDISEPHYITNYEIVDQFYFCWYCNWPRLGVSYGGYYRSSNSIPSLLADQQQELVTPNRSYARWCNVPYTFPSLDACNQANGRPLKIQFSPTASPIPGYDPTINLESNWQHIAKEPHSSPVAILNAPVGTMARVAVLQEAPSTRLLKNIALFIHEARDPLHPENDSFAWSSGYIATTRVQLEQDTGLLTPSFSYLPGRGIYAHAEQYHQLTDKGACSVDACAQDLKPVPSEINFPD